MGLKMQRLGPCRYQERKAGLCYWETLQKVPPTQRHPPESLEPPTTFAAGKRRGFVAVSNKDSDAVEQTAWGGHEVSTAAGL